MKTSLILAVAFCTLIYPVFGHDTTPKNAHDTLIIKEISKELYVCTCKPNTSNPGGNQIYFQGKYKKDLVTEEANYTDCDERFLILWNLSKLPEGVEIIEAKMGLYCLEFAGVKQGQLIYEYITEPWNEDIGFSKKPKTSINGRILTDWPKPRQYHIIDITDFIKNWYHKKIPNYGLMGYSINTETTSSAIFCTSKYLDSSLRPKLTIIYKNNKD